MTAFYTICLFSLLPLAILAKPYAVFLYNSAVRAYQRYKSKNSGDVFSVCVYKGYEKYTKLFSNYPDAMDYVSEQSSNFSHKSGRIEVNYWNNVKGIDPEWAYQCYIEKGKISKTEEPLDLVPSFSR